MTDQRKPMEDHDDLGYGPDLDDEHSVRVPFPFAAELEATAKRINPPRFRDHMTEIQALLDGTHPGRQT